MAAQDYIFKNENNVVYLTKNVKKGLSQDKREVTDNEIIGLFIFYLRKYCVEHETNTISVSLDGHKEFEAKLIIDDTSETKNEE